MNNNINMNINMNINKIGFIILRHVNSIKTNLYWILCYKSIRKIYGDEYKIVIIDDNSNKNFINNKYQHLNLINCEIIESEFIKRGEILPYYYFYKNKFFEKAIIIHDSVFIQSYIDFNLIEDVQFIWHFEHNWDNEKEEIDALKILLSDNNNLFESVESLYKDKNKWKGCFGSQSVISHNFLKNIAEKYNIFKLLEIIDSREKRMIFERVFGFLCCIQNNNINDISLFGSIHDYLKWGYKFEEYLQDLRHEHNYNDINKYINKYKIIKVWSGR